MANKQLNLDIPFKSICCKSKFSMKDYNTGVNQCLCRVDAREAHIALGLGHEVEGSPD